ncbi:MAG: hypothetical protein KF729_32130 [Sandaracinaceae bacterium]|nr:hypothetical protein [Sandaracinaceae bacterium]
MRRASLIVALALGACSRGVDDPCEARLRAIEERLTAAAASAAPAGTPEEAALPRSDRGVPFDGAPPLLVVGDEVVLAGRGVGGIEELDATGTTLRRDLARFVEGRAPADEPLLFAVLAAPDVSADALARLLRGAPADARFALGVRAAPLPALEGEPAWVESETRAIPGRPEALRERLDAAWSRATASCEPARAHVPVPPALRPADPPLGAPSVHALVAALRECRCGDPGLGAIEAVARRALVGPDGPVHRLRVTLRFGLPSDAAPAVEVEPHETVEAFARRLEGREGPLWVRAE